MVAKDLVMVDSMEASVQVKVAVIWQEDLLVVQVDMEELALIKINNMKDMDLILVHNN